jgi:nucleotide-binding universal stress UspA family protein
MGQRAQTIVVGIDDSVHSRAALRWAAYEAHLRNALLRVIHAWHAPSPTTGVFGPTTVAVFYPGYLQRRAANVAQAAANEARRLWPDLTVEMSTPRGHPSEELLLAAEQADLLVVGSRGLGGFGDLLLGSTSQYLVSHAPCPVVVVPDSDDDDESRSGPDPDPDPDPDPGSAT